MKWPRPARHDCGICDGPLSPIRINPEWYMCDRCCATHVTKDCCYPKWKLKYDPDLKLWMLHDHNGKWMGSWHRESWPTAIKQAQGLARRWA